MTDRCQHEDFAATVDVIRLGDGDHGRPDVIVGFSAEVRINCAGCGEQMVFVGAPIGVLPTKPCMSPDGTEHRCDRNRPTRTSGSAFPGSSPGSLKAEKGSTTDDRH